MHSSVYSMCRHTCLQTQGSCGAVTMTSSMWIWPLDKSLSPLTVYICAWLCLYVCVCPCVHAVRVCWWLYWTEGITGYYRREPVAAAPRAALPLKAYSSQKASLLFPPQHKAGCWMSKTQIEKTSMYLHYDILLVFYSLFLKQMITYWKEK